jgi:2-polyprenyl-3-methyl-5-hydroxy-6-metoxy-1,4-benzoquinol methylase
MSFGVVPWRRRLGVLRTDVRSTGSFLSTLIGVLPSAPKTRPGVAALRMLNALKEQILRGIDPERIRGEQARERPVWNHLKSIGLLEGVRGKRVLEVGSKGGVDSRLLASLEPAELVFVDLPDKLERTEQWLDEIRCPHRYVIANLLYMSREERLALGRFDLVWCTGVLYHNAEQLRLLRVLFNLTNLGGMVVIESATTQNPLLLWMNVVRIHHPKTYRGVSTMTHVPSRRAIASWMALAGFADVTYRPAYTWSVRWQRTVLTGVKKSEDAGYRYFTNPPNPGYYVGEAS